MKDSGIEWIGEIPKDKNLVRNKYMFNYIKGKLPKNTNKNGKGFPYIGASDLESSSDVYEVYIHITIDQKVYSKLLYTTFNNIEEAQEQYKELEEYIINYDVKTLIDRIKNEK